MTSAIINNGFNSGEMSPKLWGRTDIDKWRNAASTMRNFYVDYRGGASSRAGLAYVGMCKQGAPNVGGTPTENPPRDISFQFSVTQGFALEFGDQYMRIKSEGAYITEDTKAISGISQANPAVINIIAHGYSVGEWIFISNVSGMTNFNGLTWVVNSVVDVNHITVTDLFGTAIDSTLFNAYTSGGNAARIYTVVSPYAAIDLPYLKFSQSKDVMSLCCVNTATLTEYPTYDLERFGNTNWQFLAVTFASSIGPPGNVSGSSQSSTTINTYYAYCVTSVSSATSEESVASAIVQVTNNNISINAGTNTVTWNAVPGASSYNIYRATPSYLLPVPVGALYGFVGTVTGTSFIDTNITADDTLTPPMHFSPFVSVGITGVIPTAGGSGYTQANIGYSINTSTGTGFSGTPAVINGALTGFSIQNAGSGYSTSDTITITSGGAGAPVAATGTYTFFNNPTLARNIILNGVTINFGVSSTGTTLGIGIGGNLAATLANLVLVLSSIGPGSIYGDYPALETASYSFSGAVLTITYKTQGAAGNSYTLAAGTYGGVISGSTLTGGADAGAGGGSGATANLVFGDSTGTNPGTVAYFEQRRGYANTLNDPDTYFFSKPGAFKNMDSAIPISADDAIIGSPWAQQINGIQFMVPMQTGLITLTGNSAWLVNGGTSAAFTPSTQTAVNQVYNGCSSTVPPIVVDNDLLYVQSKGSIVRDLAYNFIQGNYTGDDKTILSSQLFDNHSILQWAYAQEPNKIIWAVRDDGIVLSLSYLKEQKVYGWARHDTNGLFQGVCSITERHVADTHNTVQIGPLTDAVYFIVKRYVRGQWVYYSERMDDRNWISAEDCFCVDAGVSYPQTFPAATLTPSAASGSGVTFIASASVFTAGNVGDVIRIGGGIATVTSYVSGTQLVGALTQAITQTVPNNPSLMPIPQIAGQWSITTPVSTVSGLNHLEGMTVVGLADGSVIAPAVVANGSITLPQAASAIIIGLPYLPQLQNMYLDPPSQTGTTQGKRKTVNSVVIRMESTRGISVGTNQPDASTQPNGATVAWDDLIEIKQASDPANPSNAIPLFTGDYFMNTGSGWDEHSQVAIQQNYPLPANISALIISFNVGDT